MLSEKIMIACKKCGHERLCSQKKVAEMIEAHFMDLPNYPFEVELNNCVFCPVQEKDIPLLLTLNIKD